MDQLDLRISHRPQGKLELGLGIDNVTDQHAYQSHPFPGRTFFLEVRTSSR